MWNSIWLSRPVLYGLALLFAIFDIVLVFLWRYSVQNDGFDLLTSHAFYYNYGPTAVMVVVVAVWRQVDYHCKAIAPWSVLREAERGGAQNVLLDYVSPIQIVSLVNAIKAKHISVVSSIIGFLLLKLITLVSTGLFLINLFSTRESTIELLKTTTFDGSLYNETEFLTLNDPSIVYTAYGILTRDLPVSEGVERELAYESFGTSVSSNITDMKVAGNVQAVVPAFHCESAPVIAILQPANVTDQHPNDLLQLQFPECQLLGGGEGIPLYALNPQTFVCPERQLSPLVQRIECSTATDPNSTENWQLLTLADLAYNQTIENGTGMALGSSVQASSWSTAVRQLTGIACRSSYSVENVSVTYDYSQVPPNITISRAPGATDLSLGGFNNSDLGRLFTGSLSAASGMFGSLLDGSYAEEYPNTLFKIMAQLANGTYEDLLDEKTMIATAERVFQQVAVQIMKKNLLQQTSTPMVGQVTRSQHRLEINETSLWLMVSGFAIMIVLVVLVLLNLSYNVVQQNPEPIISTALLLKESKEFEKVILKGTGLSEKALAAEIKKRHFRTSMMENQSGVPTLTINVSGAVEESSQNNVHPSTVWWKPLSVRRVFVIGTFLLPLAIIGALEALQRRSDNDNGLTQISDEASFSSKSLTHFIPALVMLLVATMFNSLDFTIAALAPYNALKAKERPIKSGVLSSVLGSTPPQALWVSIRNGYWAAVLTTTAALIGSVLTIVSSGLYTIEAVPTELGMQVQSIDRFNPIWTNSVLNDSGAAIITSLTESSNLRYPQYTHEELALPSLQVGLNQNLSGDSRVAMVEVKLPGMRASLNCTTASPSQFNVTTFFNSKIGASALVEATMALPEQCPFGGAGGNLTTIEFVQNFQFPSAANSSFIAKMLDIHVGPFDRIREGSEGELSPNTQKDNPEGCPSLAFIYGFADANDPSQNSVTTLMCYQVMQQVSATTTLRLPDLSIAAGSPPVVDESSAQVLTSDSSGSSAFTYRLQVHMDTELSLFNQTEFDSSSIGSPPVDNFFQGVLFGKYPMPLTALSDPLSATDFKLAIQSFYRRYMAQAISANMRFPTLAADATVLNGTLTFSDGEFRVFQNRTSKIILQAFLGTMCVLGAVAVLCSTTREILPYNPCTIAGAAALWAGSTFCASNQTAAGGTREGGMRDSNTPSVTEHQFGVPSEAQIRNNHGALEEDSVDERTFRLGWWEPEDGARRYGIDVVRPQGVSLVT